MSAMLNWLQARNVSDHEPAAQGIAGKAYLRMQHAPGDIATLQHAALIFTAAREAALAGAEPDISL